MMPDEPSYEDAANAFQLYLQSKLCDINFLEILLTPNVTTGLKKISITNIYTTVNKNVFQNSKNCKQKVIIE